MIDRLLIVCAVVFGRILVASFQLFSSNDNCNVVCPLTSGSILLRQYTLMHHASEPVIWPALTSYLISLKFSHDNFTWAVIGECALSTDEAVAISTSLCVEACACDKPGMLCSGSCPDC